MLLLFIAVLSLLTAVGANNKKKQWIEELTSHFMTIVTGREYQTDTRDYEIMRWRSDEIITYLIIGQADEEQRQTGLNHLSDLRRLTGLAFRDVANEPIQVSPTQCGPAGIKNYGGYLRRFRFPDPPWG
ncbi:MAG: hypothetical protein FJX33_00135 [Alphaproteobacteria bacterium]|nr:hypothetical protein [Alphaproteobacteria bacterium]